MTRHLATFISTDYRDGAFPPIVPAPGLVPPLFAYGDYTQAPLAGGIRLYLKPAFLSKQTHTLPVVETARR